MSPLIDISASLAEGLAVWPGDVPFRLEANLRRSTGDGSDLSAMRTTLHAGTHADAPSHVLDGLTIDRVDLEAYVGPCQVLRVAAAAGGRIRPSDLREPIQAPRVLFRTDSHPDEARFPESFAALSPELLGWLHARGVVLVGIDTPSVDPFDSAGLEAHHALFGLGMCCLEGLRLGHVAPGLYELIALPLKIAEGDGSPVRAVLWT